MKFKENLKRSLDRLMKHHKITNEELAEGAGVSRSSINRIRMNKGNPTLETLLAIANFFNISLKELTGPNDTPLQNKSDKNLTFYEAPLHYWEQIDEIEVENKRFIAICSPQEYINITKNSILILDMNQRPQHGDLIIVKNTSTGFSSVVEYLQDINASYVKSCLLEQHTLPTDNNLLPLDNLDIIGIIVEVRTILKATGNIIVTQDNI